MFVDLENTGERATLMLEHSHMQKKNVKLQMSYNILHVTITNPFGMEWTEKQAAH